MPAILIAAIFFAAQSPGNAPVTEAEARAVFTRAEKILREVTQSKAKVAPIAMANSKTPAKRAKLVTEFKRLYDIAEPKFKLTPRPMPFDPKVLRMENAAVKPKLELLVRQGALANYGPLAAGPADTLGVKEFGDAIGFFLARMAEMTHMPSPKYSPPLMDGR